MLSYEHWQSTTTANSKQIFHSQCCCQHSFQIVVNFKRFAFAVFTLDLIWPLCHRSSSKTHLSHSLDISLHAIVTANTRTTGENLYFPHPCFQCSSFVSQMLDFLAAFRPKANMPPKRVFPNYQFCIVEKISLWFPNPLAYPHPLYLTVSYFRIYLKWTCDTSRKYIFKIYLKWQCQQGGNISFLRYLKWTCIMEEMHYI